MNVSQDGRLPRVRAGHRSAGDVSDQQNREGEVQPNRQGWPATVGRAGPYVRSLYDLSPDQSGSSEQRGIHTGRSRGVHREGFHG